MTFEGQKLPRGQMKPAPNGIGHIAGFNGPAGQRVLARRNIALMVCPLRRHRGRTPWFALRSRGAITTIESAPGRSGSSRTASREQHFLARADASTASSKMRVRRQTSERKHRNIRIGYLQIRSNEARRSRRGSDARTVGLRSRILAEPFAIYAL